MESELSSIFLSKTGCQKYNAWVPMGWVSMDPMVLFMLRYFQVAEIC